MPDTAPPAATQRTSTMVCVTCRGALRADPCGWVCGCGASLWNLEALEQLGGEMLVEHLVGAARDDAPRGRPCPSCADPLAVVFAPSTPARGGRPEWDDQRVDVCVRCWMLWADVGELVNLGEEIDPAARPARGTAERDDGTSLRALLDTELRIPQGFKELLSTELRLPRALKAALAAELHVPRPVKDVLATELHVPRPVKDVLATELHVPRPVKNVLATELHLPRRRRRPATGPAPADQD